MDNESYDLYHSTFARILVEIDVSKGLPAEVLLKSSRGSWIQSLDYEGVPFRCRRCFKIGHAAAQCGFEKKTKTTTWWNGASLQHYMVEKRSDQLRSFSEVVVSDSHAAGASDSQVAGVLTAGVSPSSAGEATMINHIEHTIRPVSVSTDGASFPISGCSPVISTPIQANFVVSSRAVDFHPREIDGLAWQAKAAQVEEGWTTVTGKKSKPSGPSFDMTLRSNKRNSNCKT